MCAPEQSVDAAEVSSLYASLNKRVSVLSSRRAPAMRERELLESLAKLWPANQKAQAGLWQHWYEEEGEAAGESLREAEGDAEALTKLMDEYPDWVEPANRLATLKYIEGDHEEAVELCLRVLRAKPWHFGAASGIVMCYGKLAEGASVLRRDDLVAEANRWAAQAMPQHGPKREEWVTRMLLLIDAKLEELAEISANDMSGHFGSDR